MYGKENVVFSGPTFKDLQVESGSLRVNFQNADGLATRDQSPPTWFEVIDAQEGGWVKADARIDAPASARSASTTPLPGRRWKKRRRQPTSRFCPSRAASPNSPAWS